MAANEAVANAQAAFENAKTDALNKEKEAQNAYDGASKEKMQQL